MQDSPSKFVDVNGLIKEKNPTIHKLIPNWVIRYLSEKVIYESLLNEIMSNHQESLNFDFCRLLCEKFGIRVKIEGEENIPKNGGVIFAANHPLGGMDAIAVMSAIDIHRKDVKFLVNDVHHGPVSEGFSKWVTTAEMVDGKLYLYYDFPNDQDPHLYIDEDLTDGRPGSNIGMAFNDPSHGSDCAVIRGLDGRFHVIYEDWSPINARKHSWDSPLAGHAVGRKGFMDFEIVKPAVDVRTKATGKIETYNHPHWMQEDPKRFKSNVAEYEVHEPQQDAFGDWAAIAIGGQYYLFADYHPANGKIRIGWFTSESIDKPFEFCGEIGSGHPDPDIGFAEGVFYLINQTKHDYLSTGPWVQGVEARVGVDTDGDAKIDQWTDWQVMSESYERIEGFSKQIKRNPATLDASSLAAGTGFEFQLKMYDVEGNVTLPELDRVTLKFAD